MGPRTLAPEARIMPLDPTADCKSRVAYRQPQPRLGEREPDLTHARLATCALCARAAVRRSAAEAPQGTRKEKRRRKKRHKAEERCHANATRSQGQRGAELSERIPTTPHRNKDAGATQYKKDPQLRRLKLGATRDSSRWDTSLGGDGAPTPPGCRCATSH